MRHSNIAVTLFTTSLSVVAPATALAQQAVEKPQRDAAAPEVQQVTPSDAATEEPQQSPLPIAAPETQRTPPPSDEGGRIAELETALADQEKAIAELKAASDASKAELAALQEKLDQMSATEEEASLLDEAAEYATEEGLDLYGFLDFKYLKTLWKNDSAYSLYLPSHGSFMMTNLNLYLANRVSDTVDTLVEVRLSYLPLGQVNDTYVTEAQTVDGVPLGSSGEWERADTSVRDPGTTFRFQQGGLTIERAHATWSPRDWFKVLAGRYLTPYGIWNVDHGSPVLLGVQPPYMQIREMVPLAQTGLQLFGRFFAGYDAYVDYAVTLSNGRGPVDELVDLDENKGLGLGLKATHDGTDLTVTLGGYAYYGQYTDSHFSTLVVVDPTTGTLDDDAEEPLTYREEIIEQYDELVLSSDVLVQFSGVRLQSELVWRRADYDSVAARARRETLFSGASLVNDHLFQASNTGFGYYVLLAYELPIPTEVVPVRFTPYFMWEDTEANDTTPYLNMKLMVAGLNAKPLPELTLKAEYVEAIPESDLYGGNMRAVQGQVAVTF